LSYKVGSFRQSGILLSYGGNKERRVRKMRNVKPEVRDFMQSYISQQ
jgi:hypothetical protein